MTPRFVILAHDHPVPHLDLLLEVGDRLWAWRLEALPMPDEAVSAIRIADHRPLYLDYEGPVSGNRGTVSRLDSGTYAWVEQRPQRCIVALSGGRCAGVLELCQIEGERWEARLRQG